MHVFGTTCSACERLIKTEITYSHYHTDNYANCVANTCCKACFAPITPKAPNLIVYWVLRPRVY